MTPLPAILLVEDDPGMRRAVERVLGPFYAVQAATTVREALALLSRPGLEVALIDVQLPDGDGYALTRTIQQRQPEVDVILMTGS
ncbi:MAG TPA: response regulator, partial [Thermoanaerobaculia bacterium]|nr:response regulator [Thermoanaerobaculia bacterium]